MAEIPVQESGAAPDNVEDPVAVAQEIIADPSKKGSPEWLAAKQLLADQGRSGFKTDGFADLEKEMQALKGMSEI